MHFDYLSRFRLTGRTDTALNRRIARENKSLALVFVDLKPRAQ